MALVTTTNFAEAIATLRDCKKVATDDETSGLEPWPTRSHTGDKTCGFSTYDGQRTWYFPVSHSYGANLPTEAVQEAIKTVHEIPWHLNHNYIFDLTSRYCTFGAIAKLPKKVTDTHVGAHIYNENAPSLGLKQLAVAHIDAESDKDQQELHELLRRWGYGPDEMWRLDPSLVAPYGEQDSVLAWKLDEFLYKNIHPELIEVWEEANELSILLSEMTREGLLVDVELCKKYLDESQRKVVDLERMIRSTFHFNPKQPADVMRHFRIPDSTEDTLKPIVDRPGVKELMAYRGWKVAADTYYKSYLKDHIGPADHRIHCEIKQTGAETGRFSVRNPAMQALPQRDEEQKIKDIFIAPEGYEIWELDLSQAEIRVGCHYTGDQNVLKALADGIDLHRMVSGRIFNKAPEDVTKVERDAGKTINFSIVYGAGAHALALKLGISQKEAYRILNKYHTEFPGYRKLSRDCEQVARERGYIKLCNGRRRHFNSVYAEVRKAMSNLIQGGVAMMMQGAMVRIRREIDPDIARMVLQVHDSLVFYAKLGNRGLIPKIVEILEYHPWCSVPAKADVKIGDSLGRMKDYKP